MRKREKQTTDAFCEVLIIAEQREGWQGMQLQGFFSPAPHVSKQTHLPYLTFNYFFKQEENLKVIET